MFLFLPNQSNIPVPLHSHAICISYPPPTLHNISKNISSTPRLSTPLIFSDSSIPHYCLSLSLHTCYLPWNSLLYTINSLSLSLFTLGFQPLSATPLNGPFRFDPFANGICATLPVPRLWWLIRGRIMRSRVVVELLWARKRMRLGIWNLGCTRMDCLLVKWFFWRDLHMMLSICPFITLPPVRIFRSFCGSFFLFFIFLFRALVKLCRCVHAGWRCGIFSSQFTCCDAWESIRKRDHW